MDGEESATSSRRPSDVDSAYSRSRSLPSPPPPSPFAPFSKDGFNVPIQVSLKRRSGAGVVEGDAAQQCKQPQARSRFQSESGTAATGSRDAGGTWVEGKDDPLLMGVEEHCGDIRHQEKNHQKQRSAQGSGGDSQNGKDGKVSCGCF